jgi:hypothetical protein
MTQMIGKEKVLTDTQLRLTSNTTLQGAAQSKGTATDCLVTILAGKDGANAVAGTTTNTLQGSNTTDFAVATTVVADKGTIVNTTVAGVQNLHLAQLAFQFYRIALSAAAATTSSTSVVWNFQPVDDSFDASVQ